MPSDSKLIDVSGKPRFGHFEDVIDHINVEDADYRTPFNKPASKIRKHFAYKRFQYLGGVSGDLIFGCAMADTRYIGAVFVYVYDVKSGEMKTWDLKTPLSFGMTLTNTQDNGQSRFQKGDKRVVMDYTKLDDGTRCKSLRVEFGNELYIDARMPEPQGYQTLALCIPSSINGWVYAQKTAALPVLGEVRSALGNYDLGEAECFGHTDYSAGFMRRETFWNWACFSGINNGEQVGLNLSWGVNETGYTENCFWVGNQLHAMPQVQFTLDRDKPETPWKITSADGRVDLVFTPQGRYETQVNALLMATNFKQIFGQFNGRLLDCEGREHHISQVYGFVEDQYAKW